MDSRHSEHKVTRHRQWHFLPTFNILADSLNIYGDDLSIRMVYFLDNFFEFRVPTVLASLVKIINQITAMDPVRISVESNIKKRDLFCIMGSLSLMSVRFPLRCLAI